MRFLVVGCGSAGKRHLGNYQSLGVTDIGAVDTRADRLEEVAQKFNVQQLYSSMDQALESQWDAVVVTTPPAYHVQVASQALKHGAHTFIEKPISSSLEGVEDMISLASQKGLTLMNGYTYRFWPPLQKFHKLINEGAIGKVYSASICFSEYLPDWHPWEDYRTFYMASKQQGGGAILDESHTIDFARWIFGEIGEVACLNDKVSSLELSSDDAAIMLVRFESGVIGTIHMDIFGRSHQKSMEAMGEKGNLRWDFYKNIVELYHGDERRWEIFQFTQDRNFMFLEEAKNFLECVKNGATPPVDGRDGLRTLRCVLAGMESARTKRFVSCAAD